jgi:DNA-binding GntR family transcriptional regulator
MRDVARSSEIASAENPMAGETTGEGAYRQIKRDIVFGRLAPSSRLKLDTLRASYGVSVSTLREILNRLCSEGFVVAEGQRGFEVEAVSAQGFREVAGMRLLLECHALEASFAAGDLEWEGNVVAAHHKLSALESRMAAGDRSIAESWKGYDREFHRALVAACASEVLLEAHADVYDKYLRYQMVGDIYRGEVAAREHRQLLACALRRDFSAARETLMRHVDECVEAALARDDVGWLQTPSASQQAHTAKGTERGRDGPRASRTGARTLRPKGSVGRRVATSSQRIAGRTKEA